LPTLYQDTLAVAALCNDETVADLGDAEPRRPQDGQDKSRVERVPGGSRTGSPQALATSEGSGV
jgi:hypothetical protein